MELRDDQELSWWGHPAGMLRPAVRLALALACVATVMLPFAGSRVLWAQGGDDCGLPKSLFENGLAALALFGVLCFAWPKFALSRYVRLAVMLPIVHLVVVAVAWPAWLAIAPKLDIVERWYYLADEIPMSAIVIGELVIVAGAARLIAGRRRDTAWSHAFVMISLVELLLLGLWLPIVSWATCHGSWRVANDPGFAMDHAVRLTMLVIVPPLVAAIGYSCYAIRWPEQARSQRTEQIGALVMLLLVAIGLRADSPPAARVVYANYIHLLLGAQIVATAGPLLLGLGIWLRGKAIRRRLATDAGALTGVVVSDDHEPVVACFEITSWLRPPRPLVRSFSVATPGGEVPIHGARLVAPLDPSTTALSVGESYGALRAGDRITISSSGSETNPSDGRGPSDGRASTVRSRASLGRGRADDQFGLGPSDGRASTVRSRASLGRGRADDQFGLGPSHGPATTVQSRASLGRGRADDQFGLGPSDGRASTVRSRASLGRGRADDQFGLGPFRNTAAPIVGADPVVAPYGVPQLTFSDLALSLWRPAVAYLVILVAVAIPALAALIAPPG